MYVHAFVDFQILILIGVGAIVIEPIDYLCQGGNSFVNIDRLQLHRVLVGVIGLRIGDHFNLSEFRFDLEGPVLEDLDVGIHISVDVPLLHYPVSELLAGRSIDGRRAQRTSAIDIEVGVGNRASATVEIVADADSGSAVQNSAPLSVDVILLGDPETAIFFIAINNVIWVTGVFAVYIIWIGRGGILVIIRRDRIFIQHDRIPIEDLCTGFIGKPADEFIAVQTAGRGADLSAVADTEVHCLFRVTPVDIARGGIRIVRMQEYTVLDLTPLGVDGQSALRHIIESKWLITGCVHIPALEDEAFRNVSRFVAVVIRNISTVNDAGNELDLALAGPDLATVTVYIDTIHEVDFVLVGHVVITHEVRSRA